MKDWITLARNEGIEIDAAQQGRFGTFAARLEETNRTLNLTRVPPEEYGLRHFLDSLLLLKVYRPPSGSRALDVGTGAGFPGLPLAIVLPEVQFTLLDATRKRLLFLDAVIAELGLANVQTLHARAEDAARLPAHRHQYTLVTSRAVAPLERLLGWTLPFVKRDGHSLAAAYKSRETDLELSEAKKGLQREKGELFGVEEIALADTVRRILLFRPVSARPA